MTSAVPPEPKPPLWKNPFAIAFVLGALVLTALPLLQQPFLKAPPPVRTLGPWQLRSLDGGVVSSRSLAGTVWLLELVPSPCDDACHERARRFAFEVSQLDDLDGGAAIVLVAAPDAAPALAALPEGPGWRALSGAPDELDTFAHELRLGWLAFAGTDAGATTPDFFRLPAVAVIDQNGALRGFWKDDVEGRGNSLNAARLLARRGPNP